VVEQPELPRQRVLVGRDAAGRALRAVVVEQLERGIAVARVAPEPKPLAATQMSWCVGVTVNRRRERRRRHAPDQAAVLEVDDRDVVLVLVGRVQALRADFRKARPRTEGHQLLRDLVPGRAPESDLAAVVIAVHHPADAVRVSLAPGRLESP
jgi:hypothetical protein